MINRWFHRPHLHTPLDSHERRVGWLELFYDLIYVAAIIQLGNALSNDVSVMGFLRFAGLFVPIWYTWTGFTFFNNRFVVDDFAHRMMVFSQMFAIGAVAVQVPAVFEGRTAGFALAYGVVRVIHAAFYLRAWRQVPAARAMNRRYTLGYSIAAALWLGSSLLVGPWVYLTWAVAMVVDLSVPLSRQSREVGSRFPPDTLHMSERYGLLTIIVLGESFVKVLSQVTIDYQARHAVSLLLMCGMGLLITCSLWWIYFDDVAGSRIRRTALAPYVWIYGHLPMTIAVTASGVAIKKAVFFDVTQVAGESYRWLLCGSLGLALLSVGIVDAVTERRQSELSDQARVNIRVASAFFILLLAPAGAFMPSYAFLGMVVAAGVLQVLFDMSMAPLAADPHAAHHEARHMWDVPAAADDAAEGEGAVSGSRTGAPKRPPGIDDAIRKGVPNELKNDLYVHFMEGSWTRIFIALVATFLLMNVVFASLYMLEPGAVSGVHDDSFLDAFAFSVQTMSTIGYGGMTPSSSYAHMLVTAQALISILTTALATGLLFAKASRPRASVLFSDVAVIHQRYGVPTLIFRIGNARGNDIVEATVAVVAVCDEITPEGHSIRRLYDLRLVRQRTPLFALSWTVFHEIDADSPFFGLTADNAHAGFVSLVVTMTGHDSTFSQTIHARKLYYAADVRWQRRFIDVMSTMDDGRMLLDFTHFHATEPEPIATSGHAPAADAEAAAPATDEAAD